MSSLSSTPDIGELRHARELLLHEREQIGYWRRLLRARIDISMAGILSPDPLSQGSGGQRDIPSLRDLNELIAGDDGIQIELLDRAREADEQLRLYAQQIERQLEEVMSAMVEARMSSLQAGFE